MKCFVSVQDSVKHPCLLSMNWRTVSHEATKVPTDYTMPRCALAAIELHSCQRSTGRRHDVKAHLLLDILGNVLATVSPSTYASSLSDHTFSMENWSMAVWAAGCQSVVEALNLRIPTNFDGLLLHLVALTHAVRNDAVL